MNHYAQYIKDNETQKTAASSEIALRLLLHFRLEPCVQTKKMHQTVYTYSVHAKENQMCLKPNKRQFEAVLKAKTILKMTS